MGAPAGFMDVKEAAKRWGYAEGTISKWCREGLIDGAEQAAAGTPWKIPVDAVCPKTPQGNDMKKPEVVDTHANLKETTPPTESKKDYLLGVVFFVSSAVLALSTDKILLGLLAGIGITIWVAILRSVIRSTAKKIKEAAKEGQRKATKSRTKAVIKLLLVIFVVLAVIIGTFSFVLSKKSPKCINCGKNYMYTETGYCYTCYKELFDYIKENS